jgi:hypothetical protein
MEANWIFIASIITASLSVVATIGHCAQVWCDYDARRALIEKPLSIMNILVPGNDSTWIYEDIKWNSNLDTIAKQIEAYHLTVAISQEWRVFV